MELILLYITYGQPYQDGANGWKQESVDYSFNTVSKQVELKETTSNGGAERDFTNTTYSIDTTVPFWFECVGTTKKEYYHDGTGGFTTKDVLNSTDCGYTGGGGTEQPQNPTPTPTETKGTGTAPVAKYLAVGGVLSNPILYAIDCNITTAIGALKLNHYVNIYLYREGQDTPFATARQRLRNGQAKVDVAEYVKVLVESESSFIHNTLISVDNNVLAGFYIGFVECYSLVDLIGDIRDFNLPLVLVPEIRYAINAANQQLDSDFSEYVIDGANIDIKLITLFREPVKTLGYPCSLGTIIDESQKGKQLYFERQYLDINRSLLETKSTPIPQQYYGKFLRLNILDAMLNCAEFVRATVTDTNINTDGVCPDGSSGYTPEQEIFSPEPPTVQADDNANTLTASHNLGTSEILMRTNGGSWGPYAPVNVGNVDRPVDYWQFKIKSADGRGESAIVGNPKFTAKVQQYTLTVQVNGIASRLDYDIYINGDRQAGNIFAFKAGTALLVDINAPGYKIVPESANVLLNANQTLIFNATAMPYTYWSWAETDPYAALFSGNDTINYQSAGLFESTEDIITDFHTMPAQQYAVLRVPVTHKLLTAWTDSGSTLNYGQIPDSIFRAPFTVGQFTYYVTRVPVDFSTGPDDRVIFRDNDI